MTTLPAPRELPTGTVTLLFTDIEGSTRLSSRIGDDRYRELLTAHRDLLRAAVAGRGGIEFGTEGDALFAVFPSAASALEAAAEAQRSLGMHRWPDDAPIRVRMGIHTGEVAHEPDGGYVGLALHRVARITAAAHGGQVLLSAATRAVAGERLPAGLGTVELGRHHLKDFDEPERLYQLTGPGMAGEFPPLRTIDATPNNLPRQLTSFVGREAAIAEARRLFEGTRLLTLTGPGGTGKTRLSIRLAEELVSDFPDGAYFVALEPIRDAALVPSTIANALRLAESTGRTPLDVVIEYLRDRSVLLVLDNFEQVAGAAPMVGELLRGTAELRIIATTRAALRVSGEQEYPVPPLGLPDPKAAAGPAAISQYEAVALFLERAATVRPDFRITADNAPAIAEICFRLDGLPLAIELAAARIRLLSPQAILGRLERRLGLLSGGARDLPERQQTLRGAIAWSHDLLDPPQRALFARLSVFVGGWTLDAAQAICDPAGDLGADVLDVLAALVDQSLARQEDREGEPRFLMLETIREFAAEQLAATGEEPAIRERHARYFLAMAEALAPHLTGADRATHLDALEADHDNERAALTWAIETADPDAADRLVAALWRFWQSRDHLVEGRARAAAALAVPGEVDPAVRARAHEAAGGIAWWAGDMARVQQEYESALELARSVGEPALLADSLYNLSFVYAVGREEIRRVEEASGLQPGALGQADSNARQAAELLQEAMRLYGELGDDAGLARATWALGNLQFFRRDYAGAAATFGDALERARQSGDTFMIGWSLHMGGSAEIRTGQLRAAWRHLREAMGLMREAGETTGIVLVLDGMADLAAAAGDVVRSTRLMGAARSLEDATGTGLAGISANLIARGDVPRVGLSAADLATFAAEGRAMSLDQAIELALALPEPADIAPPLGSLPGV